MNTKHEGISLHRLSSNPLEALYAEEWQKQAPTTLGCLLNGQDKNFHDYTQRDATVAATIIQWLGSPVGQSFVAETLKKHMRNQLEEKRHSKEEQK